ncbi:MAG: MmgE/PrpD family protein [Syntrophaceae bacterium]|nr:MmgE/PrpD family protein [Syntrophaceae bacterium]
MEETAAELLANYAVDLKFDQIPDKVIEKAKTCLLNGLGVALTSYNYDPVNITMRATTSAFGDVAENSHRATVVGQGKKVSLAQAVFVNGMMFHIRGQEDTYFPTMSHFGPIMVPVVLALGESYQRTGKEVIEALIIGYQVAAVAGSVSEKISTTRGFRASSIYGQFGSAAAAGKLLKLNKKEMANAMRFAANQGCGLNQVWMSGTMEYSIHMSQAALGGLLSAVLAKEGGEAAEKALEGKAGFYRAYAGVEQEVIEPLRRVLKEKYHILDVSYKPFNICGLNLSPVIAVLELMKKTDINPDEIAKIKLGMNPEEAAHLGTNNKGPYIRFLDTAMSAQYCVATAIKHRKMTMAGMLEFDDPQIMDLVGKCSLISDENCQPLCCYIEIETKDGKKHKNELIIDEFFYDYSFEREAEILRGMQPEMGISPSKFEKLVDALSHFETVTNAESIIDLIIK